MDEHNKVAKKYLAKGWSTTLLVYTLNTFLRLII